MVTRCHELRLLKCYFVAMVAPCALQWTFCGISCMVDCRDAGFELCRASVGGIVAVCSCCFGCMWGLVHALWLPGRWYSQLC